MIGYYAGIQYTGYWPLDAEWPGPGVAVRPLFRNVGTGEKEEIAPPYYIDPDILPSITGGSGSDTFAFFCGS